MKIQRLLRLPLLFTLLVFVSVSSSAIWSIGSMTLFASSGATVSVIHSQKASSFSL